MNGIVHYWSFARARTHTLTHTHPNVTLHSGSSKRTALQVCEIVLVCLCATHRGLVRVHAERKGVFPCLALLRKNHAPQLWKNIEIRMDGDNQGLRGKRKDPARAAGSAETCSTVKMQK
jgi:hypothetical protein